MKLFEQMLLLSRIDGLIRKKATGSPTHLAEKLNVSERQIYRLINELKSLGFPVVYSKQICSYMYEGIVKIRFEVIIDEEKTLSIKGGERFFESFFQTDKKWQYPTLSL